MFSTFSTESSIPVGLHLIANSLTEGTEKSMVARWLAEYKKYSSRHLRSKKVLEAVAEGYDTLSELCAQTGIPQTSCVRILEALTRSKKIKAQRVKSPSRRIEIRYEIVET